MRIALAVDRYVGWSRSECAASDLAFVSGCGSYDWDKDLVGVDACLSVGKRWNFARVAQINRMTSAGRY